MQNTEKECKRCRIIKSIGEFNLANKEKNTYKSWCKECDKNYNSIRYSLKQDKIRAQNQKWQQENREKYLKYQKDYNDGRKQ